jgi:predicted transcriptional regulator of viral defense system
MDKSVDSGRLGDWVDHLLSKGQIAFSLSQAQVAFRDLSEDALNMALSRLSKKSKILSIFKGYYLIITPTYASRGILPASLYIDGLMAFLNRDYYTGLLSAAAFHGAAHQQPQEFFVITTLPPLRPTERKGTRVNYISKTSINEKLIERRKTESGYLKISNPALTATDLVQFEKKIGGLNRVATVLNELAEVLKPEMFTTTLFDEVSQYSIQRLGYILEYKVDQKGLADALYLKTREANLSFFRVPLKAGVSSQGFSSDQRWKVIDNIDIEIDE